MIRPHDQFGNHEGGPHIRYVQQYATDSHPSQPVQVHLLKWDGFTFVGYGLPFRIGDTTTPDQIGSGDRFWIVWRSDSKRWYPVSGSQAGSDLPAISIRNDSGVTLQSRSIVRVGQPLTFPAQTVPPPSELPRQGLFRSLPPLGSHAMALLLSAVAANEVTDAITVGIQPVLVNFTDALHTRARIIPSDYVKLQSDIVGPCRIISRALEGVSGSQTLGLQWAYVELNAADEAGMDFRAVSYDTIGAATGTLLSENITPGTGLARLYYKPASGPAGTGWKRHATPVTFENWMFGNVVPSRPVKARPSRWAPNGSMIYATDAQGCEPVTDSSSG